MFGSLLGLFTYTLKDLLFPAAPEFEVNQGRPLDNVELLDQKNVWRSILDIVGNEDKLIVFWATWCPPCVSEVKMILDLIAQGKITKEKVILINSDYGRNDLVLEKVDRWKKENNLVFETYYEPETRLLGFLKVSALPFSLKVRAKDKIIVWMNSGELTPELIEEQLNVAN